MIVSCAKCNKPAEEVESWYDSCSFEHVFVARCHGESEETRIPHSWFQFGPVGIISAIAFKDKQEQITNE